MAGASAH
ncbi:hypothetical protein YPPY04_1944, partial [Yersinia pestis PY-04]